MAIRENAIETLVRTVEWYGYQDDGLTQGLKSSEDAIKLFRYWEEHSDILPEYADEGEWENDDGVTVMLNTHRIQAIGYDPLVETLRKQTQESEDNDFSEAWCGDEDN